MNEQDKRDIEMSDANTLVTKPRVQRALIMQHQGSIDVTKMINAEAALLCARLYLRAGKRYLQEGLLSTAVAALYDAILFAMHYCIAEPSCRGNIDLSRDDL
ncbi:MAG TPA: hypothetical protein VJM08_09150 [Anaerolineales bacterium]|nr:hypothetical protein [Anaerolineales bacterium]